MQFHPHDIFIQKERNGQRFVWLSHSLLLRTCTGLSDGYLRKERSIYKKDVSPSYQTRDILPDTGKAWRYAKINKNFYYAYANIPDKAPAHYKSQFPSCEELLNAAAVCNTIQDEALETHLKTYLNENYKEYKPCYGDCTKVQQDNLAKAAAVLEAAVVWVREKNINLKKYDFVNEFTSLLKKHDVPYLPQNERVFKGQLIQVVNGIAIAEMVRLKRKGNDNAKKYDDEEVKSWIIQLRSMDGLNFTNSFIIRKVRQMCVLTDRPTPSDRWIGNIMEQHNTTYLTAQERFGSNERYSTVHRGYVPLKNALFAGDCWQVDGTRVNIIDHKAVITKVDKATGEVTEENVKQFLYIIAVRDVHSGDVIGWHFDTKEDRWAVFNAIKMAAEETGYLPYQMVFDRFPGHNTPEMINFLSDLEQCGVNVKFTHKASGKASLERWFGTLQTVFMQESRYYYGEGVKSRNKYAHRSKKYIAKLRTEAHKNGFDWDAAVVETNKIIHAFRNTAYCEYSRKHKVVEQSPSELHNNSPKPHVIQLEEYQQWYLFGLKKEIQISHQGLIETEIHKTKFYYRTKDAKIVENHGRVLMCYHLEDLSRVMLYKVSDNPLKQFLGYAKEEDPAQVFGPNPQWGKVKQREAIILNMEEHRLHEQHRLKVVGSDIVGSLNIMSPITVSKHSYEQAESDYLQNEWRTKKQPPTEDNIEFDVSDQY